MITLLYVITYVLATGKPKYYVISFPAFKGSIEVP